MARSREGGELEAHDVCANLRVGAKGEARPGRVVEGCRGFAGVPKVYGMLFRGLEAGVLSCPGTTAGAPQACTSAALILRVAADFRDCAAPALCVILISYAEPKSPAQSPAAPVLSSPRATMLLGGAAALQYGPPVEVRAGGERAHGWAGRRAAGCGQAGVLGGGKRQRSQQCGNEQHAVSSVSGMVVGVDQMGS